MFEDHPFAWAGMWAGIPGSSVKTCGVCGKAENLHRPRKPRGFAAYKISHPEEFRALCKKGGRRAHELGTAHEFTSEQAREAGQKGGSVSWKNRVGTHAPGAPRRGPDVKKEKPDGCAG